MHNWQETIDRVCGQSPSALFRSCRSRNEDEAVEPD